LKLQSATASEAPSRAATLALVGHALCLDFTNTSSGRGTPMHQEHLRHWENLLAWAEHAEVIEASQRRGFASSPPSASQEAFARALELREALHRIFRAIIAGESPPAAAFAVLNRMLAEAMTAAEILPAGTGYRWGWRAQDGRPMRLLWPVARSAAELLTGPLLARVKFCPGAGCGWLFLDKTRNGTRRWCEMEICGSRAKMRRYHQRRRAAAESPF
jgi:predicted RNA-binding Zn ribbon-like protein